MLQHARLAAILRQIDTYPAVLDSVVIATIAIPNHKWPERRVGEDAGTSNTVSDLIPSRGRQIVPAVLGDFANCLTVFGAGAMQKITWAVASNLFEKIRWIRHRRGRHGRDRRAIIADETRYAEAAISTAPAAGSQEQRKTKRY
jgi:hypothetical protein